MPSLHNVRLLHFSYLVLLMYHSPSCFAPRASDDVVGVAKLCKGAGIPHVINNAYGVQSTALCKEITSAWRKGKENGKRKRERDGAYTSEFVQKSRFTDISSVQTYLEQCFATAVTLLVATCQAGSMP